MTKLNENRQDSALAQLLVHAPLNNDASESSGAKASLEELALLTEGKLDEVRRQEVIGQLNRDQLLYESWLTLQELLQKEDSALESVTAVIQPSRLNNIDKISIIDKIQNWLVDLFSWQGAFATSFGLVLGVVLVTQLDVETQDDFEPNMGNTIVLHAPIQTPQKADMAQVNSSELVSQVSGVQDTTGAQVATAEIIRIEGNKVQFKLTLSSGEVLNQTYVYKPNNK